MTATLSELYMAQEGRLAAAAEKLLPCRHKPTLIFKAGELEIHGASRMHVDEKSVAGFDLVVNLTGQKRFRDPPNIFHGRKWSWLNKFYGQPAIEELVIDWKDYGILPVGRSFWVAFYDGLQKSKKKVLVFCEGGHGRTGTAVGCLMTIARKMHGGQAIKQVREVYCQRAIETKEQENYVRSMTERTEK